MKKRLLNIVLALTVVIAGFTVFSGTAKADEIGLDWEVTYNGEKAEKPMDDNFGKTESTKSAVANAMPGDTLYYEVTYTNNTTSAANFYLNTGVAKTLEKGIEQSGGAYSYVIEKVDKDGKVIETIFDNDTIGGDLESDDTSRLGLLQANQGKDTYFNLGSVPAKDSGKDNFGIVRVRVVLDGNSQDNSYMASIATLSVQFGAEPTSEMEDGGTRTETTTKKVVNRIVKKLDNGAQIVILDDDVPLAGNPRTGDSIMPLVLCGLSLVLGLLLIGLYFMMTKDSRREEA